MRRRLALVPLLFASFIIRFPLHSSFAQRLEDVPPPVIESLSPPETVPPPEQADERKTPDLLLHEQPDSVLELGKLRDAVLASPNSADNRLKLVQELYRIGDLDAAIDECRMVIKLKPDMAKAHLQLGTALMAKQDWRGAMGELKDAIRFAPDLTQAHYNLGTILYTTGNLKAAIQSYQQTLELQPHFPDARYRLALVLKLAHRDQESVQAMEEAAWGGVPQAQLFLGNAYRNGQGVEKNGALAVYWWTKAAEFGHPPATAALSQLRRQALSSTQPEKKRREALDAFQNYRAKLWEEFPDFTRNGDDALGTMLLEQNYADHAIPTLLAEGYALSEVAQLALARIYEIGWEQHQPPFDKRIFICFETTANEGFLPAKKVLARIYAKGIGISADRQKAKELLKGLPKSEVQAVLDETSSQP